MRYHLGIGLYQEERVILLTLEIYPVLYWPAANEIMYASQIEVSLAYEQQPFPLALDQADLLIISPLIFQDNLQPLVDRGEKT